MGAVNLERGAIGVAGNGGGEAVPIVFLHGVGSTKRVWQPQLDHFGQGRRALAFDYPGYGESAPRPGAGRDDFAAAIVEAMDALGVEKAHICGLSLGGVIAIALHRLAPERCASLVLADSFAVHPDGRGIYERSIEAARGPGMRAMAEARTPALLGAAAGPALIDELIETMAGIEVEAFVQGAEAVWLADQRDRAAAIDCPTLVLVGDEDRITPPVLSQELAALIPHVEFQVIAGAGHIANLEQPAAFNAAINGFFETALISTR